MSEEVKTTVNDTAAEQLDTQPEGNGDQSSTGSGRMFTQDEVNRIIKERLQRDRESRKQERDDQSSARAAELEARENRMTCKEYLLESGYPLEMLDTIDTSNPAEFKVKAFKLFNAMQNKPSIFCPTPDFCAETPPNDAIAEAFSGSAKHIPKGSY